MVRNRILYFIIAAILMTLGYVTRTLAVERSMEISFVFNSMGLYFLIALILRKAASWVLFLVDFAGVGGLQGLSKLNFKWYNLFYASDIGHIIIGGPFNLMYFVYILIGVALGAILEVVIRQFNRIGLGN